MRQPSPEVAPARARSDGSNMPFHLANSPRVASWPRAEVSAEGRHFSAVAAALVLMAGEDP